MSIDRPTANKPSTDDRLTDVDGLLRVEGLKKHFAEGDSLLNRLRPDKRVKTVRAVDGVSFDLRRGEIVGLVGESGCGKSTLARTVLHLLDPTDGHIYYDGEDITEYTSSQLRAFRSDAQMIYQDPFASLNPRYTVRRTLTEPMSVHDIGNSTRERVERAVSLLERVGLGEEHLDRHPHEFSGGQRQRVAIARALAVEPELLVADEPTSALDVSVQAQILNLLFELQREMGLTVLFITHDLSVVRRICDRVAVMYLGEIVEVAPTKPLFDAPEHPYTQALMSSIPIPNPDAARERIPLEGDVPTPIDPPSGCSFHPRCPKVIPPTDWEWGDDEWRRFLRFKTRVESGTVKPDPVREQLRSRRESGPVSDEDVIDALYEEHVGGWSTSDVNTEADGPESLLGGADGTELHEADQEDDDERVLSPEPESLVRDALTALLDRNRSVAVSALDERYTSVCATSAPARNSTGEDHVTACHLYDEGEPGTPDGAIDPAVPNEATTNAEGE